MFILEELYSGNINPSVRYIKDGSEYQKISGKLIDEINKLRSGLSREEKQLFDKITDIHCELCAISERERYIDGFCTGAKIMWEIFNFKSRNYYS